MLCTILFYYRNNELEIKDTQLITSWQCIFYEPFVKCETLQVALIA